MSAANIKPGLVAARLVWRLWTGQTTKDTTVFLFAWKKFTEFHWLSQTALVVAPCRATRAGQWTDSKLGISYKGMNTSIRRPLCWLKKNKHSMNQPVARFQSNESVLWICGAVSSSSASLNAHKSLETLSQLRLEASDSHEARHSHISVVLIPR